MASPLPAGQGFVIRAANDATGYWYKILLTILPASYQGVPDQTDTTYQNILPSTASLNRNQGPASLSGQYALQFSGNQVSWTLSAQSGSTDANVNPVATVGYTSAVICYRAPGHKSVSFQIACAAPNPTCTGAGLAQVEVSNHGTVYCQIGTMCAFGPPTPYNKGSGAMLSASTDAQGLACLDEMYVHVMASGVEVYNPTNVMTPGTASVTGTISVTAQAQ